MNSVKAMSEDGTNRGMDDKIKTLLLLAEEYFNAAYASRESGITPAVGSADVSPEHKFFTIGLACLKTILAQPNLRPDIECNVRFDYASVLFNETVHSVSADKQTMPTDHDSVSTAAHVEQILSSGVAIADRHRLFGIKYNMQHLMARVLFLSNRRAALKYLDGAIRDASSYQHDTWGIALHFLSVSFRLSQPSRQNLNGTQAGLTEIVRLAMSSNNMAILAFAKSVEVMVHLYMPQSMDSTEQAQRALMSARSSLQSDSSAHSNAHLISIAALVDLCCELRCPDHSTVMQKIQTFQQAFEGAKQAAEFSSDGSFLLPVRRPVSSSQMPSSEFNGINRTGVVRSHPDGSMSLAISWSSAETIYNLGYLLSGACLASTNAADGHKSEKIISEGIKRQLESCTKRQLAATSMPNLSHMYTEGLVMLCIMYAFLTFNLCARSEWTQAQQMLETATKVAENLTTFVPSLQRLLLFLRGVLLQNLGRTGEAGQMYQILTKGSAQASSDAVDQDDVALLAQIYLGYLASHGRDSEIVKFDSPQDVSARLMSACAKHSNRSIRAAYQVLSILPASTTILATKSSMQTALTYAKATNSNQILALVLNMMSWKFYRGVIGEQAEKSARAGKAMAKKSGDVLRTIISSAMLADTLELSGRYEEARSERDQAWQLMARVPSDVRQALMSSECTKLEPG